MSGPSSDRPFAVLGIQQVAIGGRSKAALRTLWVEMLGLEVKGTFRSERENVDEDICALGRGPTEVEVDLMEPIDPAGKPAVHGTVNGAPYSAQIERLMLAYRITHHGAQVEVRVLSPRAAELQALMPFKPPPDLSRFLLSPMPGLLVDVAVQPGQAIRAGERLATIEAMKMENILVALRDGVVAKVLAGKGESLAVDQVIMEFERTEVA